MRRLVTLVRGVPAEHYIHTAMLVVLCVAFVTSFESGSEGARTLGYPAGFEFSLPLVCDVVAGVATVIHSQVRNDAPMRRLAAQFVLGPMLLSWGANAVDHVKAAPVDTGWPVEAQIAWIVGVVLAAGICPVAVAALLHLSTKYAEYKRRQVGAPVKQPVPAPKAERPVTAPQLEPAPSPEPATEPAATQRPDDDDPGDDDPPPTVRGISDPKPWSAKAQQLMKDEGVPRATAYRRAKKEFESVSA
jgi:hypothetical protein